MGKNLHVIRTRTSIYLIGAPSDYEKKYVEKVVHPGSANSVVSRQRIRRKERWHPAGQVGTSEPCAGRMPALLLPSIFVGDDAVNRIVDYAVGVSLALAAPRSP